MSIFKGFSDSLDNATRRLLIGSSGLTPEQREIDEYERCYECNLFVNAQFPWDMIYHDKTEEYIPPTLRKPIFENPIGKEIVDGFASSIFGYDKFPNINASSGHNIYKLAEAKKSNAQLKEFLNKEPDNKQKAVNDALNKFIACLVRRSFLNAQMIEAAKKALIGGWAIVTFKIIEGVFYIEPIGRKFIKNLKMDDIIPNKIKSFTEQYEYERQDPNDYTKMQTVWFKREFNENEEIEYEGIEVSKEFVNWTRVRYDKHDLGFCPAVMMASPQKRSVYHGQIDNIKAYIYFYNNVYTGLRSNMTPQYVLLKDGDSSSPTLPNKGQKYMKKGDVWVLEGRSFQSVSPDTTGFDSARQFSKEMKDEILRACRVVEIPMENYQSGAALSIKMTPNIEASGEYKVYFGDKSLVDLIKLMVKAAIEFNKQEKEIDLDEDVFVPDTDSFTIRLDFGDPFPVTEDTKSKAALTASMLYEKGLLTRYYAAMYIASYMGVPDPKEMVEQLEKRDAELNEMNMDGEVNSDIYAELLALIEQMKEKGSSEQEEETEEEDEDASES